MILGLIAQSLGRFRYLDIPHTYMFSAPAFLIPTPQILQNNVDAVIKPFQFWVIYHLDKFHVILIIILNVFFYCYINKVWMALIAACVSFVVTLLWQVVTFLARLRPSGSSSGPGVCWPWCWSTSTTEFSFLTWRRLTKLHNSSILQVTSLPSPKFISLSIEARRLISYFRFVRFKWTAIFIPSTVPLM